MTESTTVLSIDGIDIPPYSARALQQDLSPISESNNQVRTINGGLVDISMPEFRKYASTITCDDQQAPALDGVWPGLEVVVHCMATLSYKTVGGSPARDVVPGSSYEDGAFTFYRPKLTMRVLDFTIRYDEWAAAIGWTLHLEEV